MSDTDNYGADRFATDVRNHHMAILHHDGLYRHLRFDHDGPGADITRFTIITWPGGLTITGGHGAYTFTSTPAQDLLALFRGSASAGINPQYWKEKINTDTAQVEQYSPDRLRTYIHDTIEAARAVGQPADLIQDAVDDEILNGEDDQVEVLARAALNAFRYQYQAAGRPDFEARYFQFRGTWEWDLTDWSPRYLWSCHAVLLAARTWQRIAGPAPRPRWETFPNHLYPVTS